MAATERDAEPEAPIGPQRGGLAVFAGLVLFALVGLLGLVLQPPPVAARGADLAMLQRDAPLEDATPLVTPKPLLDVNGAEPLTCGGVYSGDTATRAGNVSAYSCRPSWVESGKEAVYRLQLNTSQPVTATLFGVTADLDLFLLRDADPDSCIAAGDNYLSHPAEAGDYFLVIDGYAGAQGPYTFRLDCALDRSATSTPTYTPSATPTNTPTGAPGPTRTPSPTAQGRRAYLPLILRFLVGTSPLPVTFVLQDGVNAYNGMTDSTLDSFEPAAPFGSDKILRLEYAPGSPVGATQRPVLRFDLSLLPVQASVDKATLRLYVPSARVNGPHVYVAGLLRHWDEAAATWELAAAGRPWAVPGASAVGADRTEWTGEPQQVVLGSTWYEFDVTTLVRGWAAAPESNYGLIMGALPGYDPTRAATASFVSREGVNAQRPQLVISYRLPYMLRD